MPRTYRRRTPISNNPIFQNHPMTFTLGWELEASGMASQTPIEIECGYDGSVSGDGREYKIRSQHVTDPHKVLTALKKLVHDERLRVDRSCGYHVHVGLANNTPMGQAWASWMVSLARALEPVAFDAVPASRRNNRFCRRWNGGNVSGSVQSVHYSESKYSNDSRYYWMNVVEMFRPNGIRTCEIRLLGNTRRFTYLLGWTSVCQLMANAAWRLLWDASAFPEEITNLQTAFNKIKTQILPNENAAVCMQAANELASKAGFRIRAEREGDASEMPVIPSDIMGRVTYYQRTLMGRGLNFRMQGASETNEAYLDYLRRFSEHNNVVNALETPPNAPRTSIPTQTIGIPTVAPNEGVNDSSIHLNEGQFLAWVRTLRGIGIEVDNRLAIDNLRRIAFLQGTNIVSRNTNRCLTMNEIREAIREPIRTSTPIQTNRGEMSCVD